MASRVGGRQLAQRAAVDEEKKKKKVVREEATLILPTKGKGKQAKTRSTLTEKPDPNNTRRPITRSQKVTVDEGRPSSRVTARQRASIARHESRFLTVTAVNIASKRTEKEGQKSTTTWREKTACTHPTTAAALKASAAPGKKTRQHHSIRSQTRKSHAPSTGTASADGGKNGATFTQRATAEAGRSGALQVAATRGGAGGVNPTSTIPLPDVIVVANVRDPDIDTTDEQLCPEYIKDIYRYLLELERRPTYAIKENLLANQKQMTEKHRRILIDWVVQVHRHYILVPETLYLTVNIMDRVLQVKQIQRDELQLLAVTAMFIASKYEEIYPPSVLDLVYITSDTYTSDQVLRKETEVLKTLNYELNYPSGLMFLRRYSKLMSTDKQVHHLAKYILELSFLETGNSCIPSSEKAGAALLLAASLLHPHTSLQSLWCPTLSMYSGYEMEHLQVTKVKLERSLYTGHRRDGDNAIREKYSKSEFMEVSKLKILEQEAREKS